MKAEKWTPSGVDNYLELSWNREDHILKAGETIAGTLILNVDENVDVFDDFNFDITITTKH